MSTIHVERGVQFRTELYKAPDRTAWFKAMGDELATRKLSITVAPGVDIKSGDDAVNLWKRYNADKAGLQAALNLPQGVRLENYFFDLVAALDDCVKTTSDVKDKVLDFGPSSEMSKILGLDSKANYASKQTQIGAGAPDKVFSVLGIQLSRTAAPQDPLKDKIYMDSTTFASMPPYQWARDSVELEQVFGVTGIDSKALVDALRATNSAGRTTFQKLRKPEVCEAYSLGYRGVGLDEMKWDEDSHKMREANKFVSLTIEQGFNATDPGRFEPNKDTGIREISVGTDKMDDTYYDTAKFDLLDNDFSVRGRARWDNDTTIRRILIGVKTGSAIDEFGLKRCAKVDVRNDEATAEEIAALDTDLRSGKTHWGRNREEVAVKPLKGLYDGLNAKGLLPDVGPHNDVLLLEPKVHVRSVRSRYHLNETPLDAIQNHYKATTQPKVQLVLDLVAKSKAGLSGNDLTTVNALETSAKALLDNSAIARLAEEKLKKLDPAMTVTADSIKDLLPNVTRSAWGSSTNDAVSIEKKRIVAEAVDQAYHAFAEQLDGARRIITQSQDRTYETYPDMFMAFAKGRDRALLNKQTTDAFIPVLDGILARPAAEQEADLKAFNEFGEKQKADGNKKFKDFKALNLDGLKALRPQLVNEQVRVAQRQLESGGSTALSLWFDEARSFYVPLSKRNTGNFLIDTTDMSEFVKHSDWEGIPADKRTPANQLPKDKIFHATLVNETQIELGLEKPYLDRMDNLQKQIKDDQASLVMKHFAAIAQPGVDPVTPESNHAALTQLLKLPAAQRDAAIAKLNEFLVAQKSGLQPLTAEALGRLDVSFFTSVNRDMAVRTTGDVEANLAGARFVFEQYRDIQQHIVKSKGDRILKALKDAGAPNSIGWKQTDASKGDQGMEILAGRR